MLKRFLDLVIATSALICLSPIVLVVGLLVAFRLGRPVLFRQPRIGYSGKVIQIFKFRSMTDERDANGELLSDEFRLPPFGQWLRRTSLDELPQLISVIKGDLSLVGPRPLLVEYLPLYNEHQMRRHEVLPGITGWAQVNGRNSLSWKEKFDLDVWYVDNQSIWLDLCILWKTLGKVFYGSDVTQNGNVTMERFKGNND
jgi:sugar transferase EpsL